MIRVQHWAQDYVETTDLAHKCAPPPAPERWEDGPPVRRLSAPGRPPELEVVARSRRTPRKGALRDPRKRAQLVHTFWHHELQAAELFCWALLAFPDTPVEFRRGLLAIQRDEVRHMSMYRAHLERLGGSIGDFPVRDWFWQRVPQCETPLQFVSLVGLGLEGANLDHSRRYAEWFEEAGDLHGAEVQRVVGSEEVTHVRFAVHWFAEWTGGVDFERWRTELVAPLTPTMFRGPTVDRERRRQAGLPDEFVAALEAVR